MNWKQCPNCGNHYNPTFTHLCIGPQPFRYGETFSLPITEERVREIVREEIARKAAEQEKD